jgi:hypothetical protein
MRTNIMKTAIASFLGSIFFCFFGLLMGCDDSSVGRGDEYYFPIVVSEAKAIPNPVGSSVSEEQGHKYGSAWVRRSMSNQSGRGAMRAFYEGQLLKNGWLPQPDKSLSTTEFVKIDYFCKNALEAEVAFERGMVGLDSETSAKISINWSSANGDRCPG